MLTNYFIFVPTIELKIIEFTDAVLEWKERAFLIYLG